MGEPARPADIASPDPEGPADAALVALKVVPGSRSNEIVGRYASPLGPRLKVKVSAPPEDGRANAAVCELLSQALGVPAKCISIVRGHGHAEKVARVRGATPTAINARW